MIDPSEVSRERESTETNVRKGLATAADLGQLLKVGENPIRFLQNVLRE